MGSISNFSSSQMASRLSLMNSRQDCDSEAGLASPKLTERTLNSCIAAKLGASGLRSDGLEMGPTARCVIETKERFLCREFKNTLFSFTLRIFFSWSTHCSTSPSRM